MNGELAQVICLSSRGSSWLAQRAISVPPPLDRENSTFQFVGSLEFRLADVRAASDFRVHTVADWLRQLQDRGVARLWLVLPEARPVLGLRRPEDEQMLAGFANVGRWSLATTGEGSVEIWRATWAVGDRAAPDRRIWSVRYEGVHADHLTPRRPDVLGARGNLTQALQAARDFATRQQMDTWPAWFERALAGDPDIPYHPDLLPSATQVRPANWLPWLSKPGSSAAWGHGTTCTTRIQRPQLSTRLSRGISTVRCCSRWLPA